MKPRRQLLKLFREFLRINMHICPGSGDEFRFPERALTRPGEEHTTPFELEEEGEGGERFNPPGGNGLWASCHFIPYCQISPQSVSGSGQIRLPVGVER